MTIEQIRAGIRQRFEVARQEGTLLELKLDADVDDLLGFLDEQGVAIKVERELPLFAYDSKHDLTAKSEIQESMRRAGWAPFESLV